jgi:hypothetical protein
MRSVYDQAHLDSLVAVVRGMTAVCEDDAGRCMGVRVSFWVLCARKMMLMGVVDMGGRCTPWI